MTWRCDDPPNEEPPCPPWVDDDPYYWPSVVEEYKGNPLAECIHPLPDSDAEIMKKLTLRPKFDEAELELPNNTRILLPDRLLDVFIPVAYDVTIYKWLYRLILRSYRSPARNPMTPEGQYFLHYGKSRQPTLMQPGRICLLAALSGLGKTAKMRRMLSSLSKPVIRHSRYGNKAFTETQILFLWRDAPSQSSLKAYAQQCGSHADALLGQSLYASHFSDSRQSRSALMSQLKTILANHFVAALIIDVAEHLTVGGPDGFEGFEAEFESLRDEFGTSIILIGTYKLVNRLRARASSSLWRKIQEGGYFEIKRPLCADDKVFRHIAEAIWEYQWLRDPMVFDDQIAETLYTCSAGITGVMIILVVLGQLAALEQGEERLDSKLLQQVYQERFTPLHDILNALLLNRENILNHFDDLYEKGMDTLTNSHGVDTFKRALDALKRRTEEQVGSNPTPIAPKRKSQPAHRRESRDVAKRVEKRKGIPDFLNVT